MEYVAATNPDDLGRELIETLRIKANLEYSQCHECVAHLVRTMQHSLHLPQLADLLQSLGKDLLEVDNCSDFYELSTCLTNLSRFKCDSQQRSWSVHEDEADIIGELTKLQSLLILADKRVCMRCVSENDYTSLYDLAEFYQMEVRSSVRLELLKCVESLCVLDEKLVSLLLATVLPVELAKEIHGYNEEMLRTGSTRFLLIARVLTLLFSTGEPFPYTHYTYLGDAFILFILNTLAVLTSGEPLVALLLAYNLHDEDRLLVRTLLDATHHRDSGNDARVDANSLKVFAETILVFTNKSDEPVWPYDDPPTYANSIVKFLNDLFSESSVDPWALFYSNDRLVLVEIVLRELSDRSAGPLRSAYLALFRRIVVAPTFADDTLMQSRCNR